MSSVTQILFCYFFLHIIHYLFLWFSLFVSFNRRCPPGHMVKANSTGKFCMYTLCASRPCHRGTCVAQSPSKFTCHCPEGYRGQHCEVTLAIYRDDVGLSFSSLFAICICFMALLGIYLQHVLLKKNHVPCCCYQPGLKWILCFCLIDSPMLFYGLISNIGE